MNLLPVEPLSDRLSTSQPKADDVTQQGSASMHSYCSLCDFEFDFDVLFSSAADSFKLIIL